MKTNKQRQVEEIPPENEPARWSVFERKQRALALADLMSRAAIEMTPVIDNATDGWVQDGLRMIASDHTEELATLLGLTKKGGE